MNTSHRAIILFATLAFMGRISSGIPYNGISSSGSLFGSSSGSSGGSLFGAFGGGGGNGIIGDGSSSGSMSGSSGPRTEMKCTPYYETVYENKCQSYSDRVCTTQHQENCYDVPGENCKAILASKQVRKCFNVTELLCSLKEDVEYEVIQATVTIQNCHKVNERVCDTVYKTQFTNKDDYKCIELTNVACIPQDKVIQDKTCKTATEFDCQEIGGGNGGNGGGMDSNDGGMVESNGGLMGSNGGLLSGSGFSSGSGGGMGSGMGSSSSNNGYGYSKPAYPKPSYGYEEPPKVICKKSTSNKCYNTPRTVSSEKCEMRKEKKCEKFAERVPFPVEKQHCHNDEKRVCELETRSQPKQVKKYVYSKQCRPIRRTICENADVKDLVQSCAPYTHKSCSYTPQEKCVDVPKEHCYKVGKKIQKQKCETLYKESSYESPSGYESSSSSSMGSGSSSGGFGSFAFSSSDGGSSSSVSSSSSNGNMDFSSSADSYGAGDFGSTSSSGFGSSESSSSY